MKKIVLAALVTLIAAPAFAQVEIVREERAKVTAPAPIGIVQAFEVTKRVARRIPGGMVLRKPAGNNVDGFAVDIVCLPDRTIVDILGDSEGAAVPTWDPKGPAPNDCVSPPGAATDDPPPPPPPPPAPSGAATADLQQQQIAALVQIIQQLQLQNAALTQQNDAIVRGLAELKATIAAGVKIRF